MKKRVLSTLAVVLMLALMLLIATGCSANTSKKPTGSTASVETQNPGVDNPPPSDELPIDSVPDDPTKPSVDPPKNPSTDETTDDGSKPSDPESSGSNNAESPEKAPNDDPPTESGTGTSTEVTPPDRPLSGMPRIGLEPTAELNVPYEYVTKTLHNDRVTVGTVTFISYTRLDDGDGYDRIIVDYLYQFSDQAARDDGVTYFLGVTDYYLYSDGGDYANLSDGKHSPFTITMDGVEYKDCTVVQELHQHGWLEGGYYEGYVSHTVRIPHGYDGIVMWAAALDEDNDYYSYHLTEAANLIMFRCK